MRGGAYGGNVAEERMPASTDRELLIRMEGKIDLVIADQVRSKTDYTYLRERVTEQAARIQSLEAVEYFKKGERQGMAVTVKVWWIVLSGGGGAALMAVVAWIMRSKGL